MGKKIKIQPIQVAKKKKRKNDEGLVKSFHKSFNLTGILQKEKIEKSNNISKSEVEETLIYRGPQSEQFLRLTEKNSFIEIDSFKKHLNKRTFKMCQE